jgi:hypothetical protein
MLTFMLIGVCDRVPHFICIVRAASVGDAAHKLGGGAYTAILLGVSLTKVIGTHANYTVFRPGKDTSTIVETAISKHSENFGKHVAFGDHLKRYNEFVIAEVASV